MLLPPEILGWSLIRRRQSAFLPLPPLAVGICTLLVRLVDGNDLHGAAQQVLHCAAARHCRCFSFHLGLQHPDNCNNWNHWRTARSYHCSKQYDERVHMKQIKDMYFKQLHDEPALMSGLQLPDPKAGPYAFVDCEFHPRLWEALQQMYVGSTFDGCNM